MAKVLIIGAVGVGNVVARKVAAVPQVFTDILLASRTKSKCDAIAKSVGSDRVKTARVDADSLQELVPLFERFRPEIVINVALPYQDLTIMEACLKASNEVNAEASASNPDFKKIYDNLMAFKNEEYLWWQVADYTYDTFMIRTRPKS